MAIAPENDPRIQQLRQTLVQSEAGQRQLMGFDFGSRRIGVAVAHERIWSARPLAPLTARDGIPDWERVTACILEWKPDMFIVGLPLNEDGSESEMSQRARKFGNRLHGRYGRPVEWVNEYGSTRQAKEVARQRGRRSGSYRDNGVDGIAAEIILNSFMQPDLGFDF